MCLVAFQKIFQKIFSGVWKRRRKTQIQKNTNHNPGKNHQQRQIQSDDRAVDCDPRSRSTARSRSRLLREIAIVGAISWSVDRDLGSSSLAYIRDLAISDLPLSPTYEISRSWIFLSRHRSRSRSGTISRGRDRDLAMARSRSTLLLWRAHALSLSLSLSFSGNALKGK